MPLLDRPGARIHWDATGSGTPLLLIQGLGYPSEANRRIVPGLAARHTVIELDNRGVGRSDVPPAVPATPDDILTIERMAEDAAAVIVAAGLGPAHVAGWSMGGLVAQELALTRPDLVRTLVLGCTSPGGTAAVPFTPEVAAHLAELATLPAREAAERSAPIVYAPDTPPARIAEDIALRMTRPTSRVGYLAQLTAIGRYPGTGDRLPGLALPVLVLHGSADRLVPPANAEVLGRLIPGATVRLLPGAGHILLTDATDEVLRAMLDFLAAHDPADPRPTPTAR